MATPLRTLFIPSVGRPRTVLRGTGVLTVGTITTVTDDTYYNAWPVNCRAANGNYVLGYTKAFTHHEENSGNMKVKTSSNTGSSWSAEIQGYFDVTTPWWASIIGLTTLTKAPYAGRIVASLWRDQVGVSASGEAGIVYSDDNGATWSSWIAATNGFTQEAFSAGAVVELENGDLLLPIEGSNSGQNVLHRSSHTVRSSNGGATWGSEVTIRNYVTDTRPYYETTLLLLDNGELIAIHRTSAGTGTHYISRSTDQGATTGNWGAPTSAFDGYGKPGAIQGSSGSIIVVTRRNADADAIAYTSIDRGATWSSAVVLDATMNESEYGYPIETALGSYLVHYGSQPTSSTSNADIKQVVVTEGLA